MLSQDTISEQYQCPPTLASYHRIPLSHRGELTSYPPRNGYQRHWLREEGQTRNKNTLYKLVNAELKTNLCWQWGPLWQGYCQHYKVLFRRGIAWVGIQESLLQYGPQWSDKHTSVCTGKLSFSSWVMPLCTQYFSMKERKPQAGLGVWGKALDSGKETTSPAQIPLSLGWGTLHWFIQSF